MKCRVKRRTIILVKVIPQFVHLVMARRAALKIFAVPSSLANFVSVVKSCALLREGGPPVASAAAVSADKIKGSEKIAVERGMKMKRWGTA